MRPSEWISTIVIMVLTMIAIIMFTSCSTMNSMGKQGNCSAKLEFDCQCDCECDKELSLDSMITP